MLATCNRVELYAAAPNPVATADVVHWLSDAAAMTGSEAFYRYEAEACVQHLFRVGRHLLRSTHHRLLRRRAFLEWDAVTCAG